THFFWFEGGGGAGGFAGVMQMSPMSMRTGRLMPNQPLTVQMASSKTTAALALATEGEDWRILTAAKAVNDKTPRAMSEQTATLTRRKVLRNPTGQFSVRMVPSAL